MNKLIFPKEVQKMISKYSKLRYTYDIDDYDRYSKLDDEEDKLIDAAMAKFNINDDQSISDDEIERMIPQEMKDQAKSITRRRTYGQKLDEENINKSRLIAAIEGDESFYNAAEEELKYREQLKDKRI